MTDRSKDAVIGVTMRALLDTPGSAAPNVETSQLVLLLLAKGHRVVIINDGAMACESVEHWCRGVFDRVLPVTQMNHLAVFDEIWDTRARQVEPQTGRVAAMPRVYLSPLAEWIAGIADEVDAADPYGKQTMGIVVTGMEGHVETYFNPTLARSELLTQGLMHAARLDIDGKAESFHAATEDDGHAD